MATLFDLLGLAGLLLVAAGCSLVAGWAGLVVLGLALLLLGLWGAWSLARTPPVGKWQRDTRFPGEVLTARVPRPRIVNVAGRDEHHDLVALRRAEADDDDD